MSTSGATKPYITKKQPYLKGKAICDGADGGDDGVPSPGPAFKEVWQVKVWPKGLGQAKNLVGIYRLCLTEKTVNFVKLNSDAAAVVLQLMNVRRCGHSENFFFVEVGRSAVTGPGEFWMQVEDSVVAQNMHETLLEAMKALSEEFRQRSKSQSNAAGAGGGTTASNPISVPSRRHHTNPPPSQVGFIRRPRTEPPGTTGGCSNTSPTSRHNFSRTRTTSDGAKVDDVGGTATGGITSGSSPTTNGSCSSTPILRSTSVRAPTPVKTQHPLMRSISTPTPSPAASLPSDPGSEFGPTGSGASSSCGSANGGVYSRISLRQPSVSGSLSDYGSSDEYGSSPGEHSGSLVMQSDSTVTSGSHSQRDEASNYILMSQRGTPKPQSTQNAFQQTRRVLRRSSSRECEADRRLMSKRASLPPMALERLAPLRPSGEVSVEDDYAIMTQNGSRKSCVSRQDSGASTSGSGYLDVAAELKADIGHNDMSATTVSGGPNGVVDNGYMSMLPGVTASPVSISHSLSVTVSGSDSKSADDYMAMTPNNSISPPRQIRSAHSVTDGYMMMSPNSSCSPDQRGVPTPWIGSSSAESRTGSDYMNMSPISARSANSTPPPSEPHTPSDQYLQHPPPKMVYSYYSLPRSYKHSSSTHFEEGLGRGKSLLNGGRSMAGCRGQSDNKFKHQEPLASRHLSLSSSSYSSSSASSESLGEGEEKTIKVSEGAEGGNVKDSETGLQRHVSGRIKHGNLSQRSRPLSLFVDISKANTLPRVRETPLPPEPKSPGEYVSIEFKGERNQKRNQFLQNALPPGVQHSFPRPSSCAAGFLPCSKSLPTTVPPSTASEYVNMELGVSLSPSPISLTPVGFSSFPTPPVTPVAPPNAHDEHRSTILKDDDDPESEIGCRKGQQVSVPHTGDSPTSCDDYTMMAFSLTSGSEISSTLPKPSLPDQAESVVPALGLGLALDFPLSTKVPNPDHGAKVIRADGQGRRRHCSETFQPPSSLLTSSSAFPDYAQVIGRQLGLEGTLWGNSGLSDISSQYINPRLSNISVSHASSLEQGLNYIDLDLASKECSHAATDGQATLHGPASRIFSSVLGGGSSGGYIGAGGSNGTASNLNMYASIDFYKSEELRTHQGGHSSSSSRKDGTAPVGL
ncbi:hypothetical protein DNTS_000520 [Danionella cerebrum]|uniref:IRS-type PTB domain-containing protein n=1 Tax=Danionella cerebrum TaxID=2873325 RepID=A0A553R2E6_9TELE|nr:hypothetical protein DNTS_000520 [Danionella translucida]